MFYREIIADLLKWKESNLRKPLLLRGARQVGKTTIVHLFAKHYSQYIHLNLEKEGSNLGFDDYSNIPLFIQKVFFLKGKDIAGIKDTLLFIDEIQEAPGALNMLRYLYEEAPELHVIAAGSLLETALHGQTKIPVGRVEYKVVRPCSFYEFLLAMGETMAAKALKEIPVKPYAHDKLSELFHTYVLIGGMPEVIRHYAENRNLVALAGVYQSLLYGYIDDVEKYGPNSTQVQIIRHIINTCFLEAGNRIKFQGFGQSYYGSREVAQAMQTLQRVMLLHLIYPATSVKLPLLPDRKKSPRLQVLDTGLLNHFAGLQKELIQTSNLDNVYKGKIAEHIVGQELLAARHDILYELHFWVREKTNSTAEVDFILNYNSRIIPLEVKSGSTGTLRSLHLFMDETEHELALRLYQGNLKVDEITTSAGKKFTLLNLPYYLAGMVQEYIDWISTSSAAAQQVV